MPAGDQLGEFVDALLSRLPGFVLRGTAYDDGSKEMGLVLASDGEVLRLSWSRRGSIIVASRARSHLPGMDRETAIQYVMTALGYSRRVRRHRVGISVFYRPCGPSRACKIVEYYVNKLLTPSALADYAEKALSMARNPAADIPPGSPGSINEVLVLKLLGRPSLALARAISAGTIDPGELLYLSKPVVVRAGRLCIRNGGSEFCRGVRRHIARVDECSRLVDVVLSAFPQLLLADLRVADGALLACMPVTRSISIVYATTAGRDGSGCVVTVIPEVLSEPCTNIIGGGRPWFSSYTTRTRTASSRPR